MSELKQRTEISHMEMRVYIPRHVKQEQYFK